jgi:uncharacterized membrane protein YdbT with pleckstrin-like domain
MSETVNDEKFRPQWKSFYWHIVGMVACLVVVLVVSVKGGELTSNYQTGIWLFFLVFVAAAVAHMAYLRLCVTLIVKADEVALEKGFIKRYSIEISTKNIRTIQVNQSIIQRMLNIGDIKVASAGTGEYEISAANLPNPYAIRDKIQKYERSDKKSGENED